MLNTDKDFWYGELNLMRFAFFLGRRAELFHQRLWMEDARLCEIDVACYFNAALDNVTNV
jgi:hypothetical protein